MSRLHVDSVTKSFEGRPVLTDICLTCDTGEIVGLFGLNGCGKSTLLKIISGVLKADYKYVRVDERQIFGVDDCAGLIKYLPQDNFMPASLKIRTVAGLFCKGESLESVMNHPVVSLNRDKRCSELSGGERRFFEILLFIFSDSGFVLMDEPFNGLSPLFIEEVKRVIKEQSAHKGFIVTDHDYRNILDVATRLTIMHDGALRRIDDPGQLRYWGYIP